MKAVAFKGLRISLVVFLMVWGLLPASFGQESAPVKKDLISESAQNALERYTAEIEEIERVAALRKAEAKARLLRALQATKQFEKEKGPRYRGMIGTYQYHRGPAPFLLLSVPNGTNAFDQTVRDTLNAHLFPEQNLYNLEARGHVIIPKDGLYHMEVGRGYWKFQLNGVDYRMGWITSQRYGADAYLKKGIYDVLMTVGNNGGQLQQARVLIADKKTNKPLPVFVYESEIDQAFRVGRRTGREPVEVSGWKAKENRLAD